MIGSLLSRRFAFAFVSILATAPLVAQNLLQNPSFTGNANGWVVSTQSNPSGHWSGIDVTGMTGGSAEVDGVGPISGCKSPVFQTVQVTAGATYNIAASVNIGGNQFFAKPEDAACSSCSAFVGAIWSDGSNSSFFLSSTNGFERHALNITAPVNVTSANISLGICAPAGSITAYFDDISFTLGNNPISGGILAIPETIHAGESTTLIWSSTGGSTASISGGGTNQGVALQGSLVVTPSVTTQYILTISLGNTTFTTKTTVNVLTTPPPVITAFSGPKTSIAAGASATLSWASTGGTTATIDNGVGKITPSGGSILITPGTTKTYTLTVKGAGGTSTRSVTVYVNNAQAAAVSNLTGTGIAGATDGSRNVATFTRPFGIAAAVRPASAKGHLAGDDVASYDMYVLDSNHTIRKISPDGTTSTWAGQPGVKGSANGFRTSATFDFSNYIGAIVTNADGTLDVIDSNGVQRHIDTAGNVTNACPSCARFPLPAGMVRLADHTTYISDAGNHTVTRISPTGITTVIGRSGQPGLTDGTSTVAQFNRPRGMTVDSAGNVYVLDTGNNAIRKVSGANSVSTMTVAGGSTGGGDLVMGCCAGGIAPAPNGGVYVTDAGSNTIKEVAPNGAVTTVAGSGNSGMGNGTGANATFNTPLGVTAAPDGSLIVADTSNNALRTVTPPQLVSRRHTVRH
jgi:hypothetical protein